MTRPALACRLPWRAAACALALLAGCTNLAPPHQRPALPVPATLPGAAASADGVAALPGWGELVQDDRLRQVIELALAHNRDLRVALLNVERSRAQLGLAEADRRPAVTAAAQASRAPNADGHQANTLQLGVQLSGFELDLFGRLRNASDAAAATLLASQAAARAARLAVLVQAAAGWLTLAADGEQLALARHTLASRQESLRLAELRERVGSASGLELHAARSLVAGSQAVAALYERQLAQDANALTLLIGTELPEALRPPAAAMDDAGWLAEVPAGLSSSALLARPDVIQAEHQLVAAGARIGAARAARFPRITLTGSAGQVSPTFSGLFDGGHFATAMTASAVASLFDAGRLQTQIQVAEVDRELALANYDKVLQTAFREAADALVAQSAWSVQVQAQRDLLAAERERLRLTRLRLEHGAASMIEILDAERSVAAAQQAWVQARWGQRLNRLSLYKALGGDGADRGDRPGTRVGPHRGPPHG